MTSRWSLIYPAILVFGTIFAYMAIPHSLMYIAAFWVLMSYALIPKHPQVGWALGVAGNGLYITAFLPFHRIDVEIAPVLFTALSLYNVCRELSKKSTQ